MPTVVSGIVTVTSPPHEPPGHSVTTMVEVVRMVSTYVLEIISPILSSIELVRGLRSPSGYGIKNRAGGHSRIGC